MVALFARHRDVIRAVEIDGVGAHCDTQPIEIEMSVARLHRGPRPLDKFSFFSKSTRALRPLEMRAHALVLKRSRHCPHVRATDDFIMLPHGDSMTHGT